MMTIPFDLRTWLIRYPPFLLPSREYGSCWCYRLILCFASHFLCPSLVAEGEVVIYSNLNPIDNVCSTTIVGSIQNAWIVLSPILSLWQKPLTILLRYGFFDPSIVVNNPTSPLHLNCCIPDLMKNSNTTTRHQKSLKNSPGSHLQRKMFLP